MSKQPSLPVPDSKPNPRYSVILPAEPRARFVKLLLFVMLLALCWHLPLFLPLRSNQVVHPPAAPPPGVVMLISPAQAASSLTSVMSALLDPTIFLLPSDHGFSSGIRGMAARDIPAIIPGEPAPQTQAYQSPEWVGVSPGVQKLLFSDPSLVRPPLKQQSVTNEPVEGGSGWRVTGMIADRLLPVSLESTLPKVHARDLLGPTLLRIGVSESGHVAFIFLEKSSGMEAADEHAFQLARSLQFADSDQTGMVQWGFLRVIWRPEVHIAADPLPAKLP
jgi:hypothetical protein